MFDIPIVLLIFKRKKVVDIIKRIKIIKPQKLYIIADGGRDSEEQKEVLECRKLLEKSIDWECEVIKNYSNYNRGVYKNIAGGAKWVFEREKWAIFLEDDNLPEVTFFHYCKEMLLKYESEQRILWICGTNYFGKYKDSSQSYFFTRHLLPCGWASWSNKFLKYYDPNFMSIDDQLNLDRIKKLFVSKSLYNQSLEYWNEEVLRIKAGERPSSWDMQMDYSIKNNQLFGICPVYNQIKNIGVDNASIHGGTSLNDLMTKRFCGMESYPLSFPLIHPNSIEINLDFEKGLSEIILRPYPLRLKRKVNRVIRRLFNIPSNCRTTDYFLNGIRKGW